MIAVEKGSEVEQAFPLGIRFTNNVVKTPTFAQAMETAKNHIGKGKLVCYHDWIHVGGPTSMAVAVNLRVVPWRKILTLGFYDGRTFTVSVEENQPEQTNCEGGQPKEGA